MIYTHVIKNEQQRYIPNTRRGNHLAWWSKVSLSQQGKSSRGSFPNTSLLNAAFDCLGSTEEAYLHFTTDGHDGQTKVSTDVSFHVTSRET